MGRVSDGGKLWLAVGGWRQSTASLLLPDQLRDVSVATPLAHASACKHKNKFKTLNSRRRRREVRRLQGSGTLEDVFVDLQLRTPVLRVRQLHVGHLDRHLRLVCVDAWQVCVHRHHRLRLKIHKK